MRGGEEEERRRRRRRTRKGVEAIDREKKEIRKCNETREGESRVKGEVSTRRVMR